MAECNSTRVALGLGANLGSPEQAIRRAVHALERGGLQCVHASSLYATQAVDCLPGTPPFVNAAVTGSWEGSPEGLLALCQEIELQTGRPREHSSHESRVLDIDVLLWASECLSLAGLTVPHPRLQGRLFVLVPLEEIAPQWRVPPEGLPVRELRTRLSARPEEDTEWVRLRAPGTLQDQQGGDRGHPMRDRTWPE